MEVLIYQTGKAREVASSNPDVLNKETIITGGVTFKHRFLSQYEEAVYESIDFAKYKYDKNFRDMLPQFTMFISVGSTSTQGWIKDAENPHLDYKVVIPPNPTSTEFQTIGAKMNTDVSPLSEMIESHLQNPENRVLFFNAIGYLVKPEFIKPQPVSFAQEAFVPNFFMDTLRQQLALFRDRMFVFPKVTGLNFAPAWASVLARTNRKPMIDMGGGAVYLYYPDGTKVEEPLPMDPNKALANATVSDVTERSVSLFTPEILQSIVAKLQTAGRRRRTRRATRKRRTRK
jgi:hypothetical protein